MDSWDIFLNRKTGEFVPVQQEHYSIAEETDKNDTFDGYSDWVTKLLQ